jgi:hypothetical protein
MPLAREASADQSLAVNPCREKVAGINRFARTSRIAVGLFLALAAGLASCAGDSQPDPPGTAGRGGGSGDGECPSDLPGRDVCAAGTPSYGSEAGPIIERRCATCHYPDNDRSRYVFSDYDEVYSARQTVLTRIYGCVMPPDGAPQLTPDERRVLLEWFICGAPDN